MLKIFWPVKPNGDASFLLQFEKGFFLVFFFFLVFGLFCLWKWSQSSFYQSNLKDLDYLPKLSFAITCSAFRILHKHMFSFFDFQKPATNNLFF